METMQQILNRESKNGNSNNRIYLYKMDNYWFAYECSAFYLFSICCVDVIFNYTDQDSKQVMLVSVLKNGYEKAGNPQLKVIERSEDEMTLECNITCKGFLHWKEGLNTSITDTSFSNIIRNFNNSLYKI